MDWERYYQDQINKSNNKRLNKVSDFAGNQTGGFIRSFGNFLWKQNANFRKWLHPDYQRAVDEYRKEEDERREKLLERKRKISEIFVEALS